MMSLKAATWVQDMPNNLTQNKNKIKVLTSGKIKANGIKNNEVNK